MGRSQHSVTSLPTPTGKRSMAFEDARVEPEQLQDIADVARAEAGQPREGVAGARFARSSRPC
jgi:hypothetical protein